MANRHRNRLNYAHPWKLRIASLAVLLKWLAGATVIGGLIVGVALDERRAMLVSLIAVCALVVFTAISAALAAELPCQVCRHPVLRAKGCRKHAKARPFLGISHPLTVSLCVLFNSRFRCFYCGEKIPVGGRSSASASASGPHQAQAQAQRPPQSVSASESSLPVALNTDALSQRSAAPGPARPGAGAAVAAVEPADSTLPARR